MTTELKEGGGGGGLSGRKTSGGAVFFAVFLIPDLNKSIKRETLSIKCSCFTLKSNKKVSKLVLISSLNPFRLLGGCLKNLIRSLYYT